MYFVKLTIIIFSALKHCHGWNLPPAQFLSQFAGGNDRINLVLSVPSDNKLHPMKKYYEDLTSSYKIPTSLTFIENKRNKSISQNPQELIVFVPGESEIDKHIELYIEWFNQRKRTNKEFWLLDITFLNRIKKRTNDRLQKLKLDLDDDVYWFAYSERGIELYEVYRIHEDFDIKVVPFGFWTVDNGVSSPPHGKWIRRKNMEGANINVVTELYPPYITEMIPIGPDKFTVKGLYADIFFTLQSILNFTFDGMIKSPDGQWGAMKSDGTWTGMVRELLDERMDVGLQGFSLTAARAAVIDFSATIDQDSSTLFIKNPSGTFNYTAYVEPLKYMAWLAVGIFCIIAPIPIFIAARLGKEPTKSEFTWVKSVVFVLSSVTMRGGKVSPDKYSSRCAFLVILFAGLLIYYHWEAMLISYLSTRFVVLPFTNIRELVQNSDYRIALMRGSSQESFFKTSPDPYVQKAYSDRIEPYLDEFEPFSRNLIDLLLTDESLAIYISYAMGSQSALSLYKSCEITTIPARYDRIHGAIALQKDAPFNDLFNFYLKEMREKGSLQQILKKYEIGTQFCPDDSGKPLGFESCFTAFLALIAGMGLGFVIFFLENFNNFVYRFPSLNSMAIGGPQQDINRREQKTPEI